MNMFAREEELFDDWKKQVEDRGEGQFVPDGVVCETEYSDSKPKIAFILKEVNSPEEKDFDLRKFLREGARNGAHTWNNISRWTYGIENRNSNEKMTWRCFPKMDAEKRANILNSICAINLKKTPGGRSTKYEELESFAEKYGDFIRKQYVIYEPDLTICCGTVSLFKKIVAHCNNDWRETTRGVSWYERATNKYVIDFYHPAARIESSLMLYRLIDAVKEIMDKKCPS